MIFEQYYQATVDVLDKIHATQMERMSSASTILAETIRTDGIIHIFGCGHSHLVALDSFYRSGGLANVSAVLDTDLMLHNGAAKSSAMERMTGLAPAIFRRYCMTEKDALIVVSTSGKNSVPVELAQEAVRHGVKTVGVVSSAYFNDSPVSPTGKMLYESVDVFIDNCVPHGDATVEIPGCAEKMGSVSTAASAFIVQAIIMEAAARCAAEGHALPVYMSGNITGGADHNAALIDRFLPRIRHL